MTSTEYIGVDTKNDKPKNGVGDGNVGGGITNGNVDHKVNRKSRAGDETKCSDYPFILTDVVPHWPAFKKQSEQQPSSLPWTIEHLLEHNGDVIFRAEALDWPLRTYVEYMRDNQDESPLYLFDCRFAEKMGILEADEVPGTINSEKTVVNEKDKNNNKSAAHNNTASPLTPPFWTPSCFADDLFDVWDADERPDWRWLIVGPERSGSTFHIDPNGTRYVHITPLNILTIIPYQLL